MYRCRMSRRTFGYLVDVDPILRNSERFHVVANHHGIATGGAGSSRGAYRDTWKGVLLTHTLNDDSGD